MLNILKEYVKLLVESSFDDDYEAQEALRKQRWDEEAARPEIKTLLDAIMNAKDPKELAKAKRAAVKADDAGIVKITGVWMNAYQKRKKELDDMKYDMRGSTPQDAADARMDRLLRIRDSSGKATPRKF
jgi:hypothetical protein